MRRRRHPNKELDLDAALGIQLGRRVAVRCCRSLHVLRMEARANSPRRSRCPQPAGRIGGVATLRISIAGNDEGSCESGCILKLPVASGVALLAQGAYKDTMVNTSVDGTTWKVEKPFVCLSQSASSQELAYRRRTGSRKTPVDFKAAAQKIKPEAPSTPLPPARSPYLKTARARTWILRCRSRRPTARAAMRWVHY